MSQKRGMRCRQSGTSGRTSFLCSFSRNFDADDEEKTQVKQLHSSTQVRSPRLSFLLLVLTTFTNSYYNFKCAHLPFSPFPPSF
jgi:hypothetical protein